MAGGGVGVRQSATMKATSLTPAQTVRHRVRRKLSRLRPRRPAFLPGAPTRARHPPTLPPRSALSNWRSANRPGRARSKAPRGPGRQAFDEWARALGPLPARPALPFPI